MTRQRYSYTRIANGMLQMPPGRKTKIFAEESGFPPAGAQMGINGSRIGGEMGNDGRVIASNG
jgi:hypothetical protein